MVVSVTDYGHITVQSPTRSHGAFDDPVLRAVPVSGGKGTVTHDEDRVNGPAGAAVRVGIHAPGIELEAIRRRVDGDGHRSDGGHDLLQDVFPSFGNRHEVFYGGDRESRFKTAHAILYETIIIIRTILRDQSGDFNALVSCTLSNENEKFYFTLFDSFLRFFIFIFFVIFNIYNITESLLKIVHSRK